MAADYNHSNPAFEGHVTGVAANHSSQEKSVARQADAQSDDALQNVPPPQDPNISGTPAMIPMHDWRAGRLSAWQENDDYREFFEHSEVADPSIHHKRHEPLHDGDYDDNGGVALAIGHHNGMFPGDAKLSHGDLPTAEEFPLGPIIIHRI